MTALPDQARLACMLMGDVYGYLVAEDRRPEGIVPLDCNLLSGLPKDEAPHTYFEKFTRADGSIGVVERQTPGSLILPLHLARGGLALAAEMTLFSGSDDPAGGPGTPGLAADHLVRIEDGKRKRLSSIPRSQWTPEEIGTWRELGFRIRRVFRTWGELGLVDTRPTIFEQPEKLGLDGLPRVVRPTWKLLDLVRQVIPGTPWANRPQSILHDLDASERLQQPQFARDSYQQEAGGSAIVDTKEEACPGTSSSSAPAEPPTSSKMTPPTSSPSPSASTPVAKTTSGL